MFVDLFILIYFYLFECFAVGWWRELRMGWFIMVYLYICCNSAFHLLFNVDGITWVYLQNLSGLVCYQVFPVVAWFRCKGYLFGRYFVCLFVLFLVFSDD